MKDLMVVSLSVTISMSPVEGAVMMTVLTFCDPSDVG